MGIEEFLLEQAEKEGFKQGYEIGFKQGVEDVSKEMALKMKEIGLETKQISNFTGLSVEVVEKL